LVIAAVERNTVLYAFLMLCVILFPCRKMPVELWEENVKEGDHFKDFSINGTVISK
jgi:hypothetical protein